MTYTKPLVVDLDRTLVRSDTLHEALVASLRQPATLLRAVRALITDGKAAFKAVLARSVDIDLETIPLNTAVVAVIEEAHSQGRTVVLATGAHETFATGIASRFGDAVSAVHSSSSTVNLTGQSKADLLVSLYGEAGFDYVGDSKQDLAVWEHSDKALLVHQGKAPKWTKGVRFSEFIVEPRRTRTRAWIKELRLHQSLKGLVAFIPALAAHDFAFGTWLTLGVTFLTFASMSSSVYLLNDLLDLKSDRLHPRKRTRPLAFGEVSPVAAVLTSILLAILALISAYLLTPSFLITLSTYAVMTIAYSFWIKRVILLDVAVLALLYMVRLLSGAVVTGTSMSFSLTSVALFFFISLALVKRYTELTKHDAETASIGLPGRGYAAVDAKVILPLGVSSAIAVVLLLANYLQSPTVSTLYPSHEVLWLVIPASLYWVGNIWLKAGRGQVNDDPIIFAIKDRASAFGAIAILSLFLIASTSIARQLQDILLWLS